AGCGRRRCAGALWILGERSGPTGSRAVAELTCSTAGAEEHDLLAVVDVGIDEVGPPPLRAPERALSALAADKALPTPHDHRARTEAPLVALPAMRDCAIQSLG